MGWKIKLVSYPLAILYFPELCQPAKVIVSFSF